MGPPPLVGDPSPLAPRIPGFPRLPLMRRAPLVGNPTAFSTGLPRLLGIPLMAPPVLMRRATSAARNLALLFRVHRGKPATAAASHFLFPPGISHLDLHAMEFPLLIPVGMGSL